MAGKSVFERVWPISVHLRHDLDPTLLQTESRELKPFLVPVVRTHQKVGSSTIISGTMKRFLQCERAYDDRIWVNYPFNIVWVNYPFKTFSENISWIKFLLKKKT